MESVFTYIDSNSSYVICALAAVCAASLIFCAVTSVKLVSMGKRMNNFFSAKGKRGLEDMLNEYTIKTEFVAEKYDGIMNLIDDINARLPFCVQNVGLVRFNPFDGMGGDLSFSLALLNDKLDGVVISSMRGREASYAYAKPVVDAKSSYSLSEEEQKAINIAADKNKLVISYRD